MSLRRSLKTSARAWLVALVLTILAPPAWGQIDAGESTQSFGQLTGMELNPFQQMSRLRGMSEIVPMEGAVDPASYVVGPGDLFDISVGGPQPILVTLPVSADGFLTMPEAGAVEIAGLTLGEARARARGSLRQQFQNVNVEVTLSQPRQFYVHVSGAVPTPGRFVATPVARVATVLSMAYSDTTRAPVTNKTFKPALRNVKVIHTDGTSDTVDLLRYFSTGSTDHNPYLRDGDVVSVPSYDPAYEAVFVSGNVAFPGTYDHREDDTIESLLALGTGQQTLDGISKVRLSHANDDGTVDARILDVSEIGGVSVPQRAQVHVLLHETVRGSATIEGWVEYPGTYNILPGKTTLRDIVDLAGGLRSGALVRGAYLQRAALPIPEPLYQRDNRFEFTPQDYRLMRTDTLAIMQSTRLAKMDFISRAYLAHELKLQGRVPIDLGDVVNGTADPVILQDGDRIFVPRDENSVFVLGQVNRPGYVTFQPGQSYDYYISSSGGFAQNAGLAYVIKAGTGQYVDVSNAKIESGDRIFVDRDVMTADTPSLQRLLMEDRRADLEERSRTVQNIVQTIGAATAIVTTYLLIRRN